MHALVYGFRLCWLFTVFFFFFALLLILCYVPNEFIQQKILGTRQVPGTALYTDDAELESETFSFHLELII